MTRPQLLLKAFEEAAHNHISSQLGFFQDDLNELAGELIHQHGISPDFLNDTYNSIKQAHA